MWTVLVLCVALVIVFFVFVLKKGQGVAKASGIGQVRFRSAAEGHCRQWNGNPFLFLQLLRLAQALWFLPPLLFIHSCLVWFLFFSFYCDNVRNEKFISDWFSKNGDLSSFWEKRVSYVILDSKMGDTSALDVCSVDHTFSPDASMQPAVFLRLWRLPQ